MFRLVIKKSDIRQFRDAGNKINRLVASAIADALYEEFYDLIKRTPQWSGFTAASWQIGYGMTTQSMGEADKFLPSRKIRPAPAEAGHMFAVSEAAGRAYAKLEDYKAGGYTTGDLIVWNNSDQLERMISGDVRIENEIGVGAIADFENAMNTKSIIVKGNIVL